ncbi:protein of unknown function [Pararobbsia alpina]|uniref:sensor histidine kinase n=1 Tax=Pararobbsia alpina TaxID=621374 RepID=UPI0039A5AFB5
MASCQERHEAESTRVVDDLKKCTQALSLENARLYSRVLAERAEREAVARRLQSAQAELARTARLTAMGELVASIVHEINQPLGSALTGANAALRWLDRARPDIEEVRAALEGIVIDATRAGAIVRSLYALARKSGPQMKRFDLSEVVCEVLEILRGEVERIGIDIHYDSTTDSCEVCGDRVQIQQVVLNLIVNAMEAMRNDVEPHKQLKLGAAYSRCGQVVLSVIDSGPGMANDIADKAFEPFVSTKATGLGMGLAISRSIAESHGGTLTCVPNLPRGMRFDFTLPAAH